MIADAPAPERTWPPMPEGVRPATAEDFQAGPALVPWLRVAGAAVLAAVVALLAVRRWGGDLVGVTAAVTAGCAWLAAVTAQWICLRRDVPVALTLAEATVEETERGALAQWRFAEPVPKRLAKQELEPDWARQAQPGDAVAARVRETGFGILTLRLGTPTVEGWRLPPPQPVWPALAQAYAAFAFVGFLFCGIVALAPSEVHLGRVAAAAQEPWETGLGTVPWDLTIEYEAAGGEWRELVATLSHERFLKLLPPPGQRELAAPGLLATEERRRLTSRHLPLGRAVLVRETHLAGWRTVFYLGPEP